LQNFDIHLIMQEI